eukprot:sb/3472408/
MSDLLITCPHHVARLTPEFGSTIPFKSRPATLDEQLLLSPYEAWYLDLPNKPTWSSLPDHFGPRYAAYLYLKHRGYTVKPGIAFGGHFLVYDGNPGEVHASFVATVVTMGTVDSLTVNVARRCAESVAKECLLLRVVGEVTQDNVGSVPVKCIKVKRWRAERDREK